MLRCGEVMTDITEDNVEECIVKTIDQYSKKNMMIDMMVWSKLMRLLESKHNIKIFGEK